MSINTFKKYDCFICLITLKRGSILVKLIHYINKEGTCENTNNRNFKTLSILLEILIT